jgi:hypothetical protein
MTLKIIDNPDGSATLDFSGKLAKQIIEASQRENMTPQEWVLQVLLVGVSKVDETKIRVANRRRKSRTKGKVS